MKITVPIQAAKKHCCWCHMNSHITVKLIDKKPYKKWWCHLYAEDLEEDKRGPLRHEKCKEAEIEE